MKKITLLFVLFCFSIANNFAQNPQNQAQISNKLDTVSKNFYKNDTLKNKIVNLDEIVVTGTRIPVLRDAISAPISIVNRNLIEKSGETALLPSIMKQIPGIFVTSRGISGYGVSNGSAGSINMRGFSGSSGQILILIDGHPQYATIYGHPVADAYIASEVERVEVSRNSASLLYGSNAMGGAINIITRQATVDRNQFSARLMGGSYGTQRYSLTNSYKNGRFSGIFSGNYEQTDGHRTNSKFNNLTGFAKLGYDFSSQWKISGNINISKAKSQVPGQENRPLLDGKTDVLRGMAGISLENNYNFEDFNENNPNFAEYNKNFGNSNNNFNENTEKSKIIHSTRKIIHSTQGAINFYYNWGKNEINDGYFAGGTPRLYLFNSTDYMNGINIYQSINLLKNMTITGGFDAKFYGGDAYRNPETEIYADNVKLHEIAGYFLVQQPLYDFMFEAGLRLENHNLYGNEFVPHLGISYDAGKQTYLKFSFAKGFRTPNIRELYMFAVANENLLPEQSYSYDFTVSKKLFNNRLAAELTFYYIQGDNLIESVNIGESRFQNRNVGEFANKGIEISLNYQVLRDFHLHTNYSYLDMEKLIIGSPEHKFYAGINYDFWNFTVNAGVQIIDKLYLTVDENIQTSDYILLDSRISYNFSDYLEVFVKCDNLLGERYETMFGYPMPQATFFGGISLNL